MRFELTSSAFEDGRQIPRKYTGEGDDVSPPLAWTKVPEGVQQFALLCEDPDAPTSEPWIHWVIYAIPPEARSLPEGIPAGQQQIDQPIAARQGLNSWNSGVRIGYRGPMPPRGHGTHHYHFTIYGLDRAIELPPSATKSQLASAIQDRILAKATLTGTYSR